MKLKYLALVVMTSLVISCNSDQKQTTQNTSKAEPQTDNNEVSNASEKTQNVIIKTQKCVDPPSKKLDKDFSEYYLNANSEKIISLNNGGQITIPANSFETAEGTPVSGTVSLMYREFRTAAEILTSGISMVYDNGKELINFQSAGMFEMRALQSNQQLRLKEGKEIQVELASYNNESDFDFFFLDEDKKNWKFIANSSPTKNQRKVQKIAQVNEELDNLNKPEKPEPYSPGEYIFDLNYNFSQFPELKELSGILWQYDGDSEELDPEKHPEILYPTWNEVFVTPSEKEFSYELKLANEKDTLILKAKPVMDGVVLREANAKFNEKLENYNEEYKMRVAQKRQYAQEADLLRKFNIGSLGIYNYDRQYKIPEAIPLAANFTFGPNYKEDEPYQNVYLVPGDGGVVVKYTPGTKQNFRYDPYDSNMLLAILPDNKIAMFSKAEFKALDVNSNGSGPASYTFELKVLDNEPSSLDDIDDILVSL